MANELNNLFHPLCMCVFFVVYLSVLFVFVPSDLLKKILLNIIGFVEISNEKINKYNEVLKHFILFL